MSRTKTEKKLPEREFLVTLRVIPNDDDGDPEWWDWADLLDVPKENVEMVSCEDMSDVLEEGDLPDPGCDKCGLETHEGDCADDALPF